MNQSEIRRQNETICSECGKARAMPKSNLCMDCLEKILIDVQETIVED